LNQGQISSAINTGRTGVVAKIVDKQEPSANDIAKNFDQTREGILNQRRDQMYDVFISNLQQSYEKEGRIRINKRAQQPSLPGGGSPS